MVARIETVVHRKGNIYWTGYKRDAEESSLVRIFDGYSIVTQLKSGRGEEV